MLTVVLYLPYNATLYPVLINMKKHEKIKVTALATKENIESFKHI